MRDDDDGSGSGMSGWAGYVLGYAAAEDAQRTREDIDAFLARRRPRDVVYTEAAVIDTVNGWKAAVAKRDEEIERLRRRDRERTASAEALQQQLAAAGEEIHSLREQVTQHEHNIAVTMASIRAFAEERHATITQLEAEIARLKRKG